MENGGERVLFSKVRNADLSSCLSPLMGITRSCPPLPHEREGDTFTKGISYINVPFTKGKCRLNFTALISAASPLPLAQNSPRAQVALFGAVYSGLLHTI